jgi:transketolase
MAVDCNAIGEGEGGLKSRKMREMSLEEKCINTIRFLAVDAVEKAQSGHPGMPMEAASLAYILWTKVLRFSPTDPMWPNRDRFILSAGHGSMLLYAMLFLTGYDLTLDDIKNFRQWGSRTPGHPEYGCTPGVETTTGPLGQGFATGVGMAMAERYLARIFNREHFPIIDHRIYGFVSDGDIMEGISSEAASLAGHLKLGKLIYVYLDNGISIDGPTSLTFSENVEKRFEAYGWQVLRTDGYDLKGIERAFQEARREDKRPSLIIAKTRLGYGSPNKENTPEAHGAPLGEKEVILTKRNLGWPEDQTFLVPKEVLEHFREVGRRGDSLRREWEQMWKEYRGRFPELSDLWERMSRREPLGDWRGDVGSFPPGEQMATRVASGKILQVASEKFPGLLGGSADLTPSNNTYLKGKGKFAEDCGPNIHFGVREHAMGAILNGLALSRMLIPYGGTFLVFSDYMRPAIRLAAMMGLPVVYVFTHDSIGLGEDGPTHQPVEHLMSLRMVPNLWVIRPCDANETVEAWAIALERKDGPVALVLSRQNLPVIDRSAYQSASGLRRGAYILAEAKGGSPRLILMGSGSEVHLLLEARERLEGRGIGTRVVSFPCWELFQEQPEGYREEVLPGSVRSRLAVEAGVSLGWERYTLSPSRVISLDRFGASAPGKVLFEKFGFTVENVVRRSELILEEEGT